MTETEREHALALVLLLTGLATEAEQREALLSRLGPSQGASLDRRAADAMRAAAEFLFTLSTPAASDAERMVDGVMALLASDAVGPDTCRVCGKWLGYGVRALHVGRCEEHWDTTT